MNQVSESYSVRLTKDYLVFSAAHFITFDGNICERLHGHNYQVEAEVHGALDENYYVIDFIVLRDELRAIVEGMDHRMLLPTKHNSIDVKKSEDEVTATFENKRWVFPTEDCLLLPIENTTTELLARHIGLSLIDRLAARKIATPTRLTIRVDENNGQWGNWTSVIG